MKPELVLMRAIYAPTMRELERDFVVHRAWTAAEPDRFIRQACGNALAAVTTTTTGFRRNDFDALPKLEILGCFGPYYDLIDLAAARRQNLEQMLPVLEQRGRSLARA